MGPPSWLTKYTRRLSWALRGLIARASRAVLFGCQAAKSLHLWLSTEGAQPIASRDFLHDWVGRAEMPAFQLNDTFRVGENIGQLPRFSHFTQPSVSESEIEAFEPFKSMRLYARAWPARKPRVRVEYLEKKCHNWLVVSYIFFIFTPIWGRLQFD